MPRAFIQNGVWRARPADAVDPRAQRQATLRVSAAAAAATLALAVGGGWGQGGAPAAPPVRTSVVIAAPEIITAKIEERVPASALPPSPFRRRAAAPDMQAGETAQPETTGTPRTMTSAREAEIVDAGMIRAGDATYRLAGVVLPESSRMCRRLDGLAVPCLDRAQSYLQLLVKGRAVACERAPQTSDGPLEGNCRIGDADIAEQLVRQGWARATDKPEERFLLAEAAAKRQKLGMWRE